MLSADAPNCFPCPVHPPCAFCMLVCAAITMLASVVCHIFFCTCVTPHAISQLTVAPLAPRKKSASLWTRAVANTRSSQAMRKVCVLPKMEGAGGLAVPHLGKKWRPLLELRPPSCSLGVPRTVPECCVREPTQSFSLVRTSQSTLKMTICMGQHGYQI